MHTQHFFFLLFLLSAACMPAFAQTSPATAVASNDSTQGFRIQYDIVRRVDGQNIRVVVVTAGNGPEDQAAPETPSTISQQQTVQVSAKGAVLSEPLMPMAKIREQKREGASEKEEATTEGDDKENPHEERIIFRPVQEAFSMDFDRGVLMRSMTSTHDPEHKTYYTTEKLSVPQDWKTGKKTKKVAGYECTKATCTLEGLEYTIWYTTALPGTFSPLSKLWPGTPGVILALESDDQSFTATEVLHPVRVASPVLPATDAVSLTPEEMKAKRRAFIEKAMEGEGPVRVIRRNE